jgi:hypothetical protein
MLCWPWFWPSPGFCFWPWLAVFWAGDLMFPHVLYYFFLNEIVEVRKTLTLG